jgi:hypothetical protein
MDTGCAAQGVKVAGKLAGTGNAAVPYLAGAEWAEY